MFIKNDKKNLKKKNLKHPKKLPDGISTQTFSLFKKLKGININYSIKKIEKNKKTALKLNFFCNKLKNLNLKAEKFQDIEFLKKINCFKANIKKKTYQLNRNENKKKQKK